MQAAATQLKDNLWGRLEGVFTKYVKEGTQIDIKTVEQIVVDALHEESQNQVDYVMKNVFRIDVDNSGTVSFTEFGNFLFKRHCGEMSLQREHKKGKMSRGAERLMNLEEFIRLLNNAYKFLQVVCPNDVADYIFKSVDKDADGWITYVEYFKVIQLYVCKGKNEIPPPPKVEAPAPLGPERHSRLRIHLWNMLRRLYDAYVQGRSLNATDVEVRQLVFAIVGELSQAEINFLSAGLMKLDFKVIAFEPFAEHFILLIAELGLSRYSKNNAAGKKTLNRDEFIVVLVNSFQFAKLARFQKHILYKIFDKIDKNHDGLISFEEYLDWVRRFLAVLKYYGDEFYVPEDDADLDDSDPFEKDQAPPPAPVDKNKVNFVFSDYSFARQVRARVLECLIPYDQDKNHAFDKAEIEAAMVGLLKESEQELLYVTKNVFRYDRNNDGEVSYDEITNFCVEQHFGEMAIQRLHRKKFYSKGSERVMNKDEFGRTLNIALDYINMVAPQEIIDLLFSEIDLDKDGWITYVVYFLFLKYYFGSCSPIAKEPLKLQPAVKPLTDYEQFMLGYKDLNPWDRFVKIIIDQLRVIFFRYDTNKNQVFELDEIKEILEKVFGFDQNEIEYVIYNYFSFLKSQEDNVSFDNLIAIILSIYFIEIIFHRRYKSTNSEVWLTRKISQPEFILLITQSCFFIKYQPIKEDLIFIFGELDTDKDGFITFTQFVDFIRKYLGNGIDPWAKSEKAEKDASPAPAGVSDEEYGFVNSIWDELKVYFDKYDQGKKGFLNETELRTFVIEVLNETTERELNYVFWNLFRVDSNADKEVDFLEFAPFILNHAGQISLQRFHREQTKGKNSLSDQELYTILSNAYKFLSSMTKQRGVISIIYKRICKNGVLGYPDYMGWIHRAIAGRYAKK